MMMASKQAKKTAAQLFATRAGVNRQIDALLKSGVRENPAGSRPLPAAKIKADVIRFAREHGIEIARKPGKSPLLGKGEWFDVFETWGDAYDFLHKARLEHIDNGKPYPWDAPKKNPAGSRRKSRMPSTEYETQYSRDGKTWHRWNVVLYEDMARKIAADVSRDFPAYSVRVVKLP